MVRGLKSESIEPVAWVEVADNDLESAARLFADLPKGVTAIVGVGGGKALDVAKYVGFLGRIPYFAVPTSLSNDGFCSPQSSLTIRGKRRSLPAALPFGVVVDTAVCRDAPRMLTLSGVGDLVAKFTAVRDWKLAFHATGEPVDDFAALLSDGSIHSFLSHPRTRSGRHSTVGHVAHVERDRDGNLRVIPARKRKRAPDLSPCGSMRSSARPRLHGLQVGVAEATSSAFCKEKTQTGSPRCSTLRGSGDVIAADPLLQGRMAGGCSSRARPIEGRI